MNQVITLPWKPEELALIKSKIAPNCPDMELAFFAKFCEKKKLDPFARDIYYVPRRVQDNGKWITNWTIQMSIDGLRTVAERAGGYAGSDDAVFEEKNGKPVKATVTVYRIVNGEKCSFTASARWDEYYPGDKQGFMWKKMPYTMLAKCAEGLALRKGFPEANGIYTAEEMQQAVDEVKSETSSDIADMLIAKINNCQNINELESLKDDISKLFIKLSNDDRGNIVELVKSKKESLTIIVDE